MTNPPFHLAFPVTDLAGAREFYCGLLRCKTGRESERWVDFDFFGHQITAHLIDEAEAPVPDNAVDGHAIPARHFGAVLAWDDWHELAFRLRNAGVRFFLEPTIRFSGEPGEQATLFVQDPSGNYLEFKAFRDPAQLFAR
jgi:extradiol dioxygenase family protein